MRSHTTEIKDSEIAKSALVNGITREIDYFFNTLIFKTKLLPNEHTVFDVAQIECALVINHI